MSIDQARRTHTAHKSPREGWHGCLQQMCKSKMREVSSHHQKVTHRQCRTTASCAGFAKACVRVLGKQHCALRCGQPDSVAACHKTVLCVGGTDPLSIIDMPVDCLLRKLHASPLLHIH